MDSPHENKSLEQTETSSMLANGIYAAALTPMNTDLSCNCESLAKHCNDLINRGCKGIILFGTTGEGTSFSLSEREQVIKNLIQIGMDPRKLILCISCCAIKDATALTTLALQYQLAAVLIAPPFFYKNVSEEGVISFYRNIIKTVNCSELKILFYHIPQYSGVPITINIIKTLQDEFPNAIVGIKESEGNLDLTKEILRTLKDFKVFVGNEMHISEAVQLGAAGGISGLANAFPELICSLFEHGKNSKKPDHNHTIKHIKHILKDYPIFPAIKGIVEIQKGIEWHVVRPPLIRLDEQQRQKLCFQLLTTA